jgi:putative endonuclease
MYRDFSFMPFYTYILKSSKDDGYYYGHTSDIDNRLIKHNGKKVRSTKSRTPFVLHYFEIFQTKSEAYLQEQFFKSAEGKTYLREKGII